MAKKTTQNAHKEKPNKDQWVDDFYRSIKTERERFTISEHELDAILGELIETIDQQFIEAAFNFRTNLNDTQGYWSKHPYVEGFIDKLKPHARLVEKRLRTALPDLYSDDPVPEPDADLTSMVCDVEQCAYVIGVFMGAKLAGASAERLNLLRKHLIF